MSHSQFHCTGRAYLDMHGLIFETSICYWQDQPGRKRERSRDGGGERGVGRERASERASGKHTEGRTRILTREAEPSRAEREGERPKTPHTPERGRGTHPRAHRHRAYIQRASVHVASGQTRSFPLLHTPLSLSPLASGEPERRPHRARSGKDDGDRGGAVAEREATGDGHPRERRSSPPSTTGRTGREGAGRAGKRQRGRNREAHPSQAEDARTQPPRDGHAPDATRQVTTSRAAQTRRHGCGGAHGRAESAAGPPAHDSEAQRRGKAGKDTPDPPGGGSEDHEQAGENTPKRMVDGRQGGRTADQTPARSGGGMTDRELVAASSRESEEEEGRSTSDSNPPPRAERGGKPSPQRKAGPRGQGERHRPEPPPPRRDTARGFITLPGHPPWRPGRPPAHIATEDGRAGRAPALT